MSGPGRERERIWEGWLPRTQGRWHMDTLENGLQAILHEVGHQIFLLRKTFGKSLPRSLMLLGASGQKKGKPAGTAGGWQRPLFWGF